MNRLVRRITEWLSLVFIMLSSPILVSATGQPPALKAPDTLALAELKITGDEYVRLQNNGSSDIDDLSSYWLYDFNNVNPLAGGVSSSQQQLPAVGLKQGQSLLLSGSPRNTCGATVAGKLNVSLTDGGGFLQLVRLSQDASGVKQTGGDMVSWSNGANGIIQNVPSSSKDPQGTNMYYRYQMPDGYGWQLAAMDASDSCSLHVAASGTSTPVSMGSLSGVTAEPPATIISLADQADSATDTPTLPLSDIGLMSPVINELLPNPAGTGNDSTDEYIELYNPNPKSFDLSGFTLETGLTTKHKYIFPADTLLAAHSFTAFYAADTHLTLSNSGSQAALLDPFGTVINQSDPFGTAKDGVAWALAKGEWYFTSDPTPNAANVIKQASTTKTKSSKAKSAAAVKGAATSSAGVGGTASGNDTQVAQLTPIHPWTLAIVIALALAYGLYEYRFDLANRFYQFRKHRAHRARTRYAVQGR
ncbi:MAG TPA: lamin tail domain-containing protein [Candidatus Saccharimonadales bacterium]|nr:lamin tail domain-containing protein [Candidatus Saccharimonadales bacterium]